MTTLVGLALAAALSTGAATDGSPADKTSAPNISAPTSSSTDAGQIASPHGGAATAGQISTGGAATSAGQITTPTSNVSGTTQLSPTVYSVNAAAIRGHDRCDPAAGASAGSAECRNTLEQHADQFAPPAEVAPVANTDAPAANLVNDIVNSGTGSVVVAPTPH
jgi:hypothetical protein